MLGAWGHLLRSPSHTCAPVPVLNCMSIMDTTLVCSDSCSQSVGLLFYHCDCACLLLEIYIYYITVIFLLEYTVFACLTFLHCSLVFDLLIYYCLIEINLPQLRLVSK